jgi:hypothetical protein
MPIPVLVWGAATLAVSIAGAAKTYSAGKRIKKERKRLERRVRRYKKCLRTCEKMRLHARARTESLGQTRLQAVVTLGEAVKFLERARVKDRDLLERCNISKQTVIEWKTASIRAGEVISGMLRSAASGVATSAAAYGIVANLAAASTGTAISTLSGAAATNATLAWLGGGTLAAGGGGVAVGTLVMGGFAAAPALLCAGFVMQSEAEKVETETERRIAKIDKNEAQQWLLHEETKIFIHRVNELEKSTRGIEAELKSLLATSDPSLEEDAYRVAKVASALGQLLEQSVIPKS